MTPPTADDDRLARLDRVCRALPESGREDMGAHAAFTVRGKKFAYYLNDHHGDGIVSVCVRTEPGQSEFLQGADPERFYRPAYLGAHGWVGLRLDVGPVDWDEVAEFVRESYRLAAPKRLAARIDDAQG